MKYNCNQCEKQYKSYQSLWNHNKKFHAKSDNTLIIPDNTFDNTFIIPDNTYDNTYIIPDKLCNNIAQIKQYRCRNCFRAFNNYQNRWKHEKICKEIQMNNKSANPELQILQETTKQKEIDLQLKKEEAQILQLKLKLQQSDKVDNVTLKKLNKILIDRQNRIKNSNINSNNTTNIQNNITYQLVGFGREENIHNVLTNQEKRMIINSRFGSLEKLIEIIHCGNYNQFKNIIITNIKDNYMYKYDDKTGIFVLSNKTDVLNMLVNYRIGDLEVLYNEYLENNKIDERTKQCIENFINKINYETEKFKGTDGIIHDNYRQYKISEIKVLLFNNSDKILNDVSLLLSTEETEPLQNNQ